METRWTQEAFQSRLWTDFPTCCGIICSDEAARLMANTWSLQETEIKNNISGAISKYFLSALTIFECKGPEASDLSISPKPALQKMLLFRSIGLIDAVQQQKVEGGLTAKVYLLLRFRKKFSNTKSFLTIDTTHMNHFAKWGSSFVVCSCGKY